jgi:hypothetical protein
MFSLAVWYKLTDMLEVLSATTFRAMMMEAVSTSHM